MRRFPNRTRAMTNRPLVDLDLPARELAALGELAQVRTVLDFAVLSQFPDHCATLAEWLGVQVGVIRAVAARAARYVPVDELRACAEKLRPTLRFPLGVHPPQAA